ncbi:hypothetical protein BCR34DRAFT_573123 [Clohesyomyces aquaticus]|uniref:Uncharacterized protein n=1 Tax=Clohesyomyces aquaticus TaxID=1231657 RepID=A0A1Y1Z150_9PLEO|nr:hypothetical protein BCR34DRAFT_573123 [Clohesyomyces aquaticus]
MSVCLAASCRRGAFALGSDLRYAVRAPRPSCYGDLIDDSGSLLKPQFVESPRPTSPFVGVWLDLLLQVIILAGLVLGRSTHWKQPLAHQSLPSNS